MWICERCVKCTGCTPQLTRTSIYFPCWSSLKIELSYLGIHIFRTVVMVVLLFYLTALDNNVLNYQLG